MVELPVLPAEPSCPAAFPIAGASSGRRGVVCRAMQQDQDADPGVGASPRQLEVTRETQGGVYLTVERDPSSVVMFCHGSAVPVVTDEDGQGRASYTYCPTWQAARDRHLAGLAGLTEPVEPEATSMGVASHEADDPWGQARRDLDELAPGQGARP